MRNDARGLEPAPTMAKPDRPADPCVMVIFGAAGDLTKRKLVPAIANLAQSRLLPDQFAAIGVARDDLDAARFRDKLMNDLSEFASCPLDASVRDWVADRLFHVSGNLRDPETFKAVSAEVDRLTKALQTGGNALFYLATPPDLFPESAVHLSAAGLTHEDGFWRRVVFEKPFGHDL